MGSALYLFAWAAAIWFRIPRPRLNFGLICARWCQWPSPANLARDTSYLIHSPRLALLPVAALHRLDDEAVQQVDAHPALLDRLQLVLHRVAQTHELGPRFVYSKVHAPVEGLAMRDPWVGGRELCVGSVSLDSGLRGGLGRAGRTTMCHVLVVYVAGPTELFFETPPLSSSQRAVT
jgi:hypothetical protein